MNPNNNKYVEQAQVLENLSKNFATTASAFRAGIELPEVEKMLTSLEQWQQTYNDLIERFKEVSGQTGRQHRAA